MKKVFIYQPQGHGQYTFLVMARNKKKAFKIIDSYIQRNYKKDDYDIQGWGTDNYDLTILKSNEVFYHAND